MSEYKLTIYLCRHGESMYNVEKRLGGNSSLTKRGENQANKIGVYLSDKKIEAVYFSPLVRARQTAEIIQKYLPNANFIEVPELREIRYGSLEEMTIDEVRRRFPEQISKRRGDKFTWRLEDGESYEDVSVRIAPFVNEICKKSGTYCIISHKAVSRMLLLPFVNLEKKDHVIKREIEQGHLFKVTIDGNISSVREVIDS